MMRIEGSDYCKGSMSRAARRHRIVRLYGRTCTGAVTVPPSLNGPSPSFIRPYAVFSRTKTAVKPGVYPMHLGLEMLGPRSLASPSYPNVNTLSRAQGVWL